MAANAEELFLQVDASIELLRKSMKEADAVVGDFDAQTARYLDQMEKRFSGFSAGNLSNSLKAVKEDFTKNFSEIQKIAAQAIQAPVLEGGGINLNVGEAKAAADAARQQATVTRQIAEAAERAALSQGALTRETEIWVKSARTAAAAAELEAQGLARQVGQLEALQIELSAAGVKTEQFSVAQNKVAATSGSLRAGTQQLAYNISDVATSFAGGINPMIIFAQQGSQVVQAVALMREGSGGLIGFLAGPWGAAIMGAVTVLGVMGTKLIETGDAMKDVKLASNGLSDAQSVLGQMFDTTTGKIKAQNDYLMMNAQLLAMNLRNQAANERKSATDAANKSGQWSWAATFRMTGRERSPANPWETKDNAAKKLLDSVIAGRVSGSQAQALASNLDFRELNISKADYMQALSDAVSASLKEKTASDIDKSLKDKRLAPDLIDGNKRDRADAGAARAAEAARQRELSNDIDYAKQNRDLRGQLIQATSRQASSETEKAKLAIEQINVDADTLNQTIALNEQKGKLTAAEADNLRSLNEQLRRQKLINVEADNAHRLFAQQNTIAEHSLEHQIAMLTIEGDLAKTAKERKDINRRILEKEQELARRKLQAVVDDPTATVDQKGLARADLKALEQRQAKERQRQSEDPAGPMDEYLKSLTRTAGQINEDMQSIAVQGLKNFNDGLVDAIMNGKNLGDVFSNVARQIISDLIRIAIQQTIVNGLMRAMGGLFGGGGGSLAAGVQSATNSVMGMSVTPRFAGGGMMSGPGGPQSDNLLAWLSPGEFIVNADSTKKWLPLIQAINDNRMPKFADGGPVGNLRAPSISRKMLQAAGRGDDRPVRIEVAPSMYFDATVDGRAANVAAPMATQAGVVSSQMTEARMQRRARRRLG